MNKLQYLALAGVLVLVGAGCSTATDRANDALEDAADEVTEQVDSATTALEEAQEAAAMMEEKMQEVEAMATDEMVTTFAEENKEGFAADTIDADYTRIADLVDVTGGDAYGSALLGTTAEGQHVLTVDFVNLPELEEGYFYEGWLVDKDPFSFISTGATEVVNGIEMNNYTTAASLDQYDRYVLTLEPDDGDPAPADHVVEEDFVEIGVFE